jgi:hypothetical protein
MASGRDYTLNSNDDDIVDACQRGKFFWGDRVVTLPTSSMMYDIPSEPDPAAKTQACVHEWVNVGFTFDKFICKKCNCEKK